MNTIADFQARHTHRLFTRPTEFKPLFSRETLLSAVEQADLDPIRTEDSLAAAALGRRIALPPSHSDSERSMRAVYVDAMAITGRFRKPHLFVTKAANRIEPRWLGFDNDTRWNSWYKVIDTAIAKKPTIVNWLAKNSKHF